MGHTLDYVASVDSIDNLRLVEDRVRTAVTSCTACALRAGCRAPVPFDGSLSAPLGVYGEAPGATEDVEGLPFQGPSGLLFNRTLDVLGWSRDRCYVSNVVKCRPPNNEKPKRPFVVACRPHLGAELAAGRFRAILALGSTAISALTGEYGAVSAFIPRLDLQARVGGRDIPVVACYHPSYILRKRSEGRVAYEDAMRVFANQLRRAIGITTQNVVDHPERDPEVSPEGEQVLAEV